MAKFCSRCGTPLPQDAHFCVDCGLTVPAPSSVPNEAPTIPVQPVGWPTSTPVAPTAVPVAPAGPLPAIGPPGFWIRRRVTLIAAAIGLFIAVVGVGAALLISGGGGDRAGSPQKITSGATAATTTTIDPAVLKAQEDYKGYVGRIENILQQSSSGRGQVGPLVAGVENGCRVSPLDASQQIRSVIDNRSSILNQLSGLSGAPNPEAQNFYSLLQQALQSSIEADIQYKGWMDYLYTQYYNSYPVGCPNGTPPKNGAYSAALAADGKATDLKGQFVNAFNPVSTRFSFQSWQGSDF